MSVSEVSAPPFQSQSKKAGGSERSGGEEAVEIKKFGTFAGVFTPTILTILGLVMFLRAGFVMGHSGIYGALFILGIAKLITTLTGISISAIATNTEVKGGGVYYLISRTLGPEFGGTIALTLFLANALSIPFYLLGFTEAVVRTFPVLEPHFAVIVFTVFAAVAFFSLKGASVILKAQFFILIILALSVLTFLIGAAVKFDPQLLMTNLTAADPEFLKSIKEIPVPFWVLFAIYFPAATGILTGVNMSGDLKTPSRSIPQGTLAAIFTGLAVYVVQIILVGGAVDREALLTSPYFSLIRLGSVFGFLVVLGVFAATLSNALGSILGAPRVLQALAQDKLLKPVNIFAKVTKTGEPRRALILSIILTFIVIYAARNGGDGKALNMVASVVTMLFLWSYGTVNLAAFTESFGRNPSFRPRFKFFHWSAALLGAIICFAVTFVINFKAAAFAAAFFAVIYLYVQKYVMAASFGDGRRGFYYSRTRDNLLTLSSLPMHSKNWRPTIVVFSGSPTSRLELIKYSEWLSSGRGIMTVAAFVKGEFSEMAQKRAEALLSFNEFVNKNDIKAFPEVLVTPDFNLGMTHFLQSNSLGPIKPNLAIFGWSSDTANARGVINSVHTAASLNMSVGLIHGKDLPDPVARKGSPRCIDIWWRGMRNGSLMVILAYLISLNSEWSGTKIRILRVVSSSEERSRAYKELKQLIEAARMDVAIELIFSEDTFPNLLRKHSACATVVFMGFQVNADTDALRFQDSFGSLLHGMPTTILIQSTGEADLLT
ncbi:MAG: amino acid permease [Chitinispirillales bacterium]|jgi:amino acid transporter|nr:amino acid permease [Chitinispirillales bacterium]